MCLDPSTKIKACACRLASESSADEEGPEELFTIRNYRGTRQVVRRRRAHSVP